MPFSSIHLFRPVPKLSMSSVSTLKDDIKNQKHVLIQACVQTSIYLFIFFTADVIFFQLSDLFFIFCQLIYAFIFDWLFQKYFYKTYRIRLYVMPLVLSINLFMRLGFWPLQLLLVTMGIIIRSLVAKKSENKITHIFNPSAIVLMLASLALLYFNPIGLGGVPALANIYLQVPHFEIFVFCVSLITLWLPNSYTIAIGALTTFVVVDYLAEQLTGQRLMYGFVRGNILIAINLLITDPKTSPKTSLAKFVYGVFYAFSIMALYNILFSFNKLSTSFDKILAVPVLNIFWPQFESFFGRVKLNNLLNGNYYFKSRLFYAVLYAILFFIFYDRIQNFGHFPFFLDPK